MKTAFFVAALAATAVPASAQVVHQTSVEHKGQAMAVTYEPRIDYELRQIGQGRPGLGSCLWTAKVQVQRTALGADGQPVAALSRTIAGTKTQTGMAAGHCGTLTEQDKVSLLGNEAALRSHVQAVAANDASGLRAELTSLAVLGSATVRAR